MASLTRIAATMRHGNMMHSSPMPEALYTAAQTRELDRIAIEQAGMPGDLLMTRAGEAAFLLLREQWPQARTLTVVCGAGNNGGDGYVVALLAIHAGLHPQVVATVAPDALDGDAAMMALRAMQEGVPVTVLAAGETADFGDADVIVDGLLGTGLRGPVRPDLVPLISAINRSGKPVLALDIPSGLSADSGAAPGAVVQADHTITFIGVKRRPVFTRRCRPVVFVLPCRRFTRAWRRAVPLRTRACLAMCWSSVVTMVMPVPRSWPRRPRRVRAPGWYRSRRAVAIVP